MRKLKGLYEALWGLLALCLLCCFPLRGVARDNAPYLPKKPVVADSILDYMFHSASIYLREVKGYKGDLYLKGHLKVHKQNRIIKYVPSMFRLEKGINDYFHESISELQYTAPAIYDRKVRAISTTFPSTRGQIFDIMDYMKFNIYAPSLMGNRILSPLNRKAQVHYHYLLERVEHRLGGELYCIRVVPRYRSTQLVEGFLWLSSADWTIRRMNLKGRYDLVRFQLSMQMGEEEDTKYLPVLLNLDLNFKFLKNHLEMKYTGWMKYSSVVYRKPGEEWIVKKTNDHNLSNSYTLSCDTSRLVVERDSFNRIRPIPLSAYEDSLYRSADERRLKREADTIKAEPTKLKKNMVLEHFMVKKELTEAEIAESIPDLWQPLTQQQRELLAQNFTIQKYKKNETIYCEGETPENLMCLLNGKVKIYKDGVGGRSQIIRVIKDKEYFAYRAYFAEENFVTAAAAFEPCTMCLIPMPVIVQLIMENTELAMFFIKQLSKDLGISDERTVNLTQKHIRGRLAESLLFLKDTYGVEEDQCTLSIYLSREDLANLSNMTTSNAIRTLSNFAAEKLIIIDGRKIKLIDEEKLKKISKIG